MTKARRVRVNRACIIVMLILAMIGTAVSAYWFGMSSMTPQAITITQDKTVLLQAESGHIYEYAPEIAYREYDGDNIATEGKKVIQIDETNVGVLLTFADNTGYFIEK